MKYEEVLYEVADGVATVTMNRPNKLNAWTFRMDQEVRHAMLRADADPQVRVIVFTGAGRGFCAGADMGLLASVAGGGNISGEGSVISETTEGTIPDARIDFQQQYSYFPALSKPVIGAVNGAAAGLGFVLMLFCDVRIISDQAKLTTTFTRRGLIAEYGLAWMLPRLIGLSNTFDLLFTARTFQGEEAYRLGLASKVVPHERFAEEVRAYAKELATKVSPRSMKVMKRQVYNGLFQTLKESLDLALDEMMQALASDDFREGVAHFLEKRDPKFTGQ